MKRGIRNNNPGNIRITTKDKWQGLSDEQTDKSFFQFKDMVWGIRAMLVTLRNYHKIHSINTIKGLVSRWAPPFENDTQHYIDVVCERSGYSPDELINFDSIDEMCRIAQAMCYMENSVQIPISEFYKAWEKI